MHLFLQKLFKDNLKILFVMGFAINDVLILLPYTVNEAVKDNLGVKPTSNRELPYKTGDAFLLPVGQKNNTKID